MKPLSFMYWVARLSVMVSTGSACWGSVLPAWVKVWRVGLVHETNHVIGLSLDRQGNAVITGSSTGTAGDFDYVVIKYAAAGDLLWSSRYGSMSNGNDEARGMAMDPSGSVYVTGTSMTVKYNNSGNVEWATAFAGRSVAVGSEGSSYVTGFSELDFSTAKFTPNGSNVWVRIADLHGLVERSDKITLDDDGNVYVAGGGQFICAGVTCAGRFCVIKYRSNGDNIWVSEFPGPREYLTFREIRALSYVSGKVYLTGKSGTPIDSGFYTARLNSEDGAVDWTQDFALANIEGVAGLVVSQNGDTYVTGGRILNLLPNITYVTFKVDASGHEMWRRYYSNGSSSGYHRADAIALSSAGDIYVTGQSGDSPESVDWATLKYSPDGTQQWVQRYDGPAHGADRARAIAVDAAGNVYVAGTQTTTNGSTEIVLIKYVEVTSIRLEAGGNVRLNFLGNPGQSCRFQATTDLGTWSDIGNGVADTNGIATFLDTNASGFPTRFYRMVSP